MIEAAKREGQATSPGGTIVEPTSGNTGVGLAIAAADQGLPLHLRDPDKMSREKISLLRAYGAEVVICPTAVDPSRRRSYYSVSDPARERRSPAASSPTSTPTWRTPQAHYRDRPGPRSGSRPAGELDALVIAPQAQGGTVVGYLALHQGAGTPTCRWSAPIRRARSTRQPRETSIRTWSRGSARTSFPTTSISSLIDQLRDGIRPRLLPDGAADGARGGATRGRLRAAPRCTRRWRRRVRLGPDATVVTLIPDSGPLEYLEQVLRRQLACWSTASWSAEQRRRRRSARCYASPTPNANDGLPELVVIEDPPATSARRSN